MLLLTFFLPFSIEFLRRPPIDKSSELVKNIVNANETKRVQSYLVAGCINMHDSVQNISKCKLGFHSFSSFARTFLLLHGFHFIMLFCIFLTFL